MSKFGVRAVVTSTEVGAVGLYRGWKVARYEQAHRMIVRRATDQAKAKEDRILKYPPVRVPTASSCKPSFLQRASALLTFASGC